MENKNKLMSLAKKVDAILKDELSKADIKYDLAEARMMNLKTVGVQGDQRTYSYPAEIILKIDNNYLWEEMWNDNFLGKLSTRITNEIEHINRVVYTTASDGGD